MYLASDSGIQFNTMLKLKPFKITKDVKTKMQGGSNMNGTDVFRKIL